MKTNELISHIEQSVLWANTHKSKLISEILNTDGQSSYKIRHFLNNLLEIPDINYLEIGLYKGSTFVSALYKNYPKSAYGIDINILDEARNVFRSFNLNNYNLIQCDSWNLDLSEIKDKINVYLYDGAHEYTDQYKALEYYYHVLDDTFIYLVDDWMFESVENGTRDAIKNLNLKTLYEKVINSSGIGNDVNTWWNGYFISVLQK